MDALAVSYAGELARWSIETVIVVPGAFTSGTNHFARSGSPQDKARMREYESGPTAKLAEEIMKGFALTAPANADVSEVAKAIVNVVDMPARQTIVSDLVGDEDLSNAVALNSASITVAQMVGPAVAGVLIAAVGSGWAFLINAASFGAVLASLGLLRVTELHANTRAGRARGNLVEGFRYGGPART